MDQGTWTRAPELTLVLRHDPERERNLALRRLENAARGGPEWCAAMEQLADAEAELERQARSERRSA